MAWHNIEERRTKVGTLMKEGVSEREIRKICSNEFNCSISAIRADIHTINGTTANVNSVQRNRIRIRDKYTCQYCGIENPENGVIEHVIPFALGGVAEDYNLVFSCQRCNTEKRSRVWIPDNLKNITEDFQEWRMKVIHMAKLT